jgi:hypothetical protein
VFVNYLLLSLPAIIFLEILTVLLQTVKKTSSHHALSKNAILIAPNFASYRGVLMHKARRLFAVALNAIVVFRARHTF